MGYIDTVLYNSYKNRNLICAKCKKSKNGKKLIDYI